MLPAVSAAWHPWLAVLKNWRRKRYLQYNWGSEYSTAGPKKWAKRYCTTNFRVCDLHIVWYGGPAGAAGLSLNSTLILS